jgi:hypothetical protein
LGRRRIGLVHVGRGLAATAIGDECGNGAVAIGVAERRFIDDPSAAEDHRHVVRAGHRWAGS